jgi:hypothetical protein
MLGIQQVRMAKLSEGGLPTWDPFIKKLGFQDPDWTWGFSNSFKYKFVTLNILFDGRYKGLIWSQTIRKMYWGGTHPNTITKYREDDLAGTPTYVGDGVVVTGGDVIYDAQGNAVSTPELMKPMIHRYIVRLVPVLLS